MGPRHGYKLPRMIEYQTSISEPGLTMFGRHSQLAYNTYYHLALQEYGLFREYCPNNDS